MTGFWATQFGTPNFAAHGGFCSVNMAAAGMYTIGGSFWEFGEPDWERTQLFLMFGVAEDHDSNPIKLALSGLRRRGAKFISVNPVRTGYSAIADEWIGIRPGTDGLFVLSLVHELLRADKVDLAYLGRYTNAAWLVIQAIPAPPMTGSSRATRPASRWCSAATATLASAKQTGVEARVVGEATLPDGRRAVPVFQLIAERYLDPQYAPEAVGRGLRHPGRAHPPPRRRDRPRRLRAGDRDRSALDRLGRTAPRDDARPPGLDACDARHLGPFERVPDLPRAAPAADPDRHDRCAGRLALQIALSEAGPAGSEAGRQARRQVVAGKPLPGAPLGYPLGPEDLIVDDDGRPVRIDKAFSWDAPIAAHGLMHMLIRNAWKGDPYPIDTLFMYMANMAWNSAMNTAETMRMLTDKDPATGEYRSRASSIPTPIIPRPSPTPT